MLFRRHNHKEAARQSFETSPSQSRPDISMPGEVKIPCYLLDDSVAVRDFFGRQEVLREIDDYLLVKNGEKVMSKLKTVAISGTGGIGRHFKSNTVLDLTPAGKTSIAYQYVKTRKERFEAIFWLNADTADKLNNSFGRMALELKLQRSEEDRDQVMSRNLVLEWLENPVMSRDESPPPKARWLLVFDNVDDFQLMKGFWPPKGAGSVLITSRTPHASEVTRYSDTGEDSFTKRIPLTEFGEKEAHEFLHRLTRKERTQEEERAAKDLTQRLGGFPLFIKHFAGIMNDGSSSFSDLLKLYNEGFFDDELYTKKPETSDDDYEHNIFTVWSLDELKPGARMIMNVLSFLDPDHIQEDILTEGAAKIEVQDYPKNHTDYCKARDALWRRSLIDNGTNKSGTSHDGARPFESTLRTQDRLDEEGVDPELEPDEEVDQRAKPQLNVHRVLQAVSRSRMTESQKREAFGTAVSLLLTRWNRKERLWHYDRKDWPRAEHLYPHVRQLRCHYEALEPEAQGGYATTNFVRLMNCAGW